MLSITVRIADQYGNKVIVPVCEQAKLFARIAGTKTLTKDAILAIKALGYGITLQPTSLDQVLECYQPGGCLA
jgi:hypothetical protein